MTTYAVTVAPGQLGRLVLDAFEESGGTLGRLIGRPTTPIQGRAGVERVRG